MTILPEPDSFRSDDGRVEVVFDLERLPESKIKLVMEAAVAALDAEHDEGPERLTVMVTGDERLRELNKVFKGEDEVTDVLSFASENEDGWPESGDSDMSKLDRLGDIAISLPQVERQAVENGRSPERELAMITVHGVLHLLGHDHAGPDQEKIMFGKTDAVLAGIFGD